jgi:hypothetical protein
MNGLAACRLLHTTPHETRVYHARTRSNATTPTPQRCPARLPMRSSHWPPHTHSERMLSLSTPTSRTLRLQVHREEETAMPPTPVTDPLMSEYVEPTFSIDVAKIMLSESLYELRLRSRIGRAKTCSLDVLENRSRRKLPACINPVHS